MSPPGPLGSQKRKQLHSVIRKLGAKARPIGIEDNRKDAILPANSIVPGKQKSTAGTIGHCRLCNATFTDGAEKFLQHIVHQHFPMYFQLDPPSDNTPPVSVTVIIPSGPIAPKSNGIVSIATTRMVHGLSYAKCPHCRLTFTEMDTFQEHLLSHLPGQSINELVSKRSTATPSICIKCNRNFDDDSQFHEHMRQHALETYVCAICNKAFVSEFDLNLHTGSHLGRTYDCKDCGQCFENRKALAEHNKSHRLGPVTNEHRRPEVTHSSDDSWNSRQLKSSPLPIEPMESTFCSNKYLEDLLKNISKKVIKKRRKRIAAATGNNEEISIVSDSDQLSDELIRRNG